MGEHDSNEIEPKTKHDSCPFLIPGAIIVGAGPSGLATAASLRQKQVPFEIIERSNCIASLWQHKTYDRLKLHLPKKNCELPFMPFPKKIPKYPSKQQFNQYLEAYAKKFEIKPIFNRTVLTVRFDENIKLWRETTEVEEYLSRWLIVATGENAEAVVPEVEGITEFEGDVLHSSEYKSGESYEGKKVLVVGCGNSGMEVCLDLCHHNSYPSLVVRDCVHILPRDMLGKSTFELSMWMLKWLPMHLVDAFLILASRLIFGDTGRFGFRKPDMGPLRHKTILGKTPVLDIGTLDKIKRGEVKVFPGIRRINHESVEFVDGRDARFDAIIFATGYKNNVSSWLKIGEWRAKRWKGENGVYGVGFGGLGLRGAAVDARNIAQDIHQIYSHTKTCNFWDYQFHSRVA